jgi:hypothetical protein
MRSDLPTGTVTFLFTDLERSTRLLHSLGAETYAQALAKRAYVPSGPTAEPAELEQDARARVRADDARPLLVPVPERCGGRSPIRVGSGRRHRYPSAFRRLLSAIGLCWLDAGPPIRGSNSTYSEADSPSMAAEPHSSPRGRPPVFSEEVLGRASGYSYARRVGTRRGAQDLVYRMFAVAVLEHYCDAYPEKAETLAWLLWPKRRHALLTELGRVARPRSDTSGNLRWSREDVSRLMEAAFLLAEAKPSTKRGVLMMRDFRSHKRSAGLEAGGLS